MNRKGYQAQGQGLLSGHCGAARHTQEHNEAWTGEPKGQQAVCVMELLAPAPCPFSPFVVYWITCKVEEIKLIYESNSPRVVYRFKDKIQENERHK